MLTIVTVPLEVTEATFGVMLWKVTGSVEEAVALRSKLGDWAFLFGIAAKVMFWSARGVAVMIHSLDAVAGSQGDCPGWVAVTVTLPTLSAVATLPLNETIEVSLLSKVKAVNPESALTERFAVWPT